MQTARVVEQSPEFLDSYAFIPIRFQVASKLNLEALIASSGDDLVEDPVKPYWKDYDQDPSEHPAFLSSRFDTTHWGVFAAYLEDFHVGGAIVACRTLGFEEMGANERSAILLNIRVHPNIRSQGLGKLIVTSAANFARAKGCTELLFNDSLRS